MSTVLVTLLMVAAFGLGFAALEWLLPARPSAAFHWRRYGTDLLHATVGGWLVQLGSTALLTLVLLLPFVVAGPATGVAGLPWWLQFTLVLLISDFLVWLVHRLFHAVPWLWEFHKIHHSSEDLDWLAAYRFHPVDQILTKAAVMLPWALLGFAPSVIAVYAFAYGVHSLLLHANVNLSLGPLGHVVNVPRMHHWHHADHPEAYDRNFGAQLLIWDRMFGTLYTPPRTLPERYGVDDPPRETYLAHLLAPFASRAPTPAAPAAVYQD